MGVDGVKPTVDKVMGKGQEEVSATLQERRPIRGHVGEVVTVEQNIVVAFRGGVSSFKGRGGCGGSLSIIAADRGNPRTDRSEAACAYLGAKCGAVSRCLRLTGV